MKILLVIPPSTFLIDDRAFPFLGPLQIGALARREGHEVRALDLTGHAKRCGAKPDHTDCMLAEADARLLAEVADFDPRVVGFYATYALYPAVVRMMRSLKAAANGHAPKCVLGGPHANTYPEDCAKHGWNYVVASDQGGGGGEPGFLEVLRRAEAANGNGARRNLLSTDAIVRVPSRPEGMGTDKGAYINDAWPWPARDLIDIGSYGYAVRGRRATSAVSQAGCPFKCSFCSHNDGYTKMALRSPEHVAAELREIQRDYPFVGSIVMYDDEVNLRADFLRFLEAIGAAGEHGDKLTYRAFFKCGKSFMREEVFAAMARAGFVELCTGAEAADPAILAKVGKGATVEDNTAFVKLATSNGIRVKLFSMVGHPNESPESVQRLRDWHVEMSKIVGDAGMTYDFDVTVFTPTPGAPIWETPERFPGLIWDKGEIDFTTGVYHYKTIPGQYRCFTRTPAMTSDEIVRARDWVESEVRTAARLAPLVANAKDDG